MSNTPAAAVEETIGRRLKRLRLARGLSQRELAAPGVSYAYISRIEAGTRQPSVKALRRLAGKLGVSAAYLETGSELDSAGELELRLTDLELAVRLGATAGAEEQLEAILAEALAAGDAEAAARARLSLALLAREAGSFERVIELLEAAMDGARFAPVDRPDVCANLGHAYAQMGKPELAAGLYRHCIETVRSWDGSASLEARYASLLGYALGESGDLIGAEEALRHALDRARDTEDPYTRVRLYWSLARFAHAENRPALALSNARRAIALLEATEDTLNLARAHALAASIVLTRGDAAAAERHLDEAAALFGAAPSLADSVMLRVRRAQLAALRGNGANAVPLAREALAAIGDRLPGERGAALLALADGLALEGAVDEADGAYAQAVGLLEERGQWREATQARRAWARLLRGAGRERQALDVLDRAAELGLRTAPADAVRS